MTRVLAKMVGVATIHSVLAIREKREEVLVANATISSMAITTSHTTMS